ncbi:MAG: acyl-[acyl-carrier-protein]--UDP-N-acetylglucosamine O-acyltransferase, partial [Candidatus Kapabacteria bacterium]|nr:acyl-[acyl-carrier-protein]--UDP-N-acetylglucosamine O-acyltransferase [Candidatus Kapabacteria bacterium]
DCHLGNHVILSNVSQLAGHVTLGDWVILGGLAKVTQFCTVGKHSMIGADVKIVKDVAPYCLVGRNPAQVEGINKIGLRRRGFEKDVIDEIENFFDVLLFSGLNNRDGIEKFIKGKNVVVEVEEVINFIKNSTKGIHR